MGKVSDAGLGLLRRLRLILIAVSVIVVAVPVVRFADTQRAHAALVRQQRRVALIYRMREVGWRAVAAVSEGAENPKSDQSRVARAAFDGFHEAREQAEAAGALVGDSDYVKIADYIERYGASTLEVPAERWEPRAVYLTRLFSRLSPVLDRQVAHDLDEGAIRAQTGIEGQLVWLGVAVLLSLGLAAFWFVPTVKLVREAFQVLERRREEAGRTARERGAILSATAYGVLACDSEGRARSVNPAAGGIFRAAAFDIEGKTLDEFLGAAVNPLMERARQGETVEEELRITRSDRTTGLVAVSLTPMEDEGFLAIVRDLSDREAVEQRLTFEQARSRTLLESIPDAIARLDEEGRVTEYRPVPDLPLVPWGRSLEGEDLDVVIPPAAIPAFRRARSDAAGGQSSAFVFTTLLAGRERHVEARLTPLPEGGSLALFRDVTQRDQAMADLRRSEHALEASQSAAGLGSWDVELSTGRITFSRGLRELLGVRSGDEATVETVLERVAPEDREALRDALRGAEERGEPYDLTLRFERVDGTGFDGHCQGGPRDERILNIVQDVTESLQRQMEVEEAREAAERSAQAKSEFLANMSHEIRTPMNGIIGVVYLLQETELSDRQRMYAGTIQKSSENLLALVNDVLDLSKIESGKMTLERKEFSLAEVARSVADVFAPGAREKGVRFECLVDAAVPETVLGDPIRVQQMVANLVGNAVKFTERGSVTLTVRALERRGRSLEVELRVADTGIGIPKSRQASIFDSFVQADGTTTRRFGGTGLGLAITRQIVTLMGGRVVVESQEGVGSEFSVILELGVPGAVEEAPAPTAAPVAPLVPGPVLGRRVRVLLVEDNPVNQMVVRDLLTARGCEVESAEDGVQAVEAAVARPFDLVLMDIQMPRMDGLEATRRIREHGLTVPVVAMTANAMEGDRDRCLESGMDDYLAKPVRPPDLLAAVVRWTEPVVPGRSPDAAAHVAESPTAAREMDTPALNLFDPERLNEMFGRGDPMARRILEEWIRTSPPLLEQILGGEPAEARSAAHALKGSSRTVGADRLGAACEAFERAAPHETAILAARVSDVFPATVRAIEATFPPSPV